MFDWITSFVNSAGLFGVIFLMFAENVFPPIPSELIMPLAGFVAAQGKMNLVLTIAAGTLGSVLGALLWYYIGKGLGARRIKRLAAKRGRWLTVTPSDIDSAEGWFQRHGGMAVFFGRLIPTVRTFISVPAGVAEMPMGKFLIYTTVGSAAWTAFLTLCGWFLQSQYEKVQSWLNPVSTGIFVILVLYYIYRVVTFDPRRVPEEQPD